MVSVQIHQKESDGLQPLLEVIWSMLQLWEDQTTNTYILPFDVKSLTGNTELIQILN